MKNREAFIKAMLSQVKNPFVKKSLRSEYLSHIQDAIENELELGIGLEEAEAKAVENLGDPLEIGRALNQVHNPFFAWFQYIATITAFILVVIVGVHLIPPYIDYVQMNLDTSQGDYHESFEYFDIIDKRQIDVAASIGNYDYHFKDILYTKDKRILIYFSYYDIYPNTSSLKSPNILYLSTGIYIDESKSNDLTPLLVPIPLTFVDDANSILTTSVRSYKNIGILQLRNIESMPDKIVIEIKNPDNRIDIIPILTGGTQ
ncbi:MAG: permease prefix domain 1-containing protein [Erysipelothrix sp.]